MTDNRDTKIEAARKIISTALIETYLEGMEDAAKHLEHQPSFGDGKWAAQIIRRLASDIRAPLLDDGTARMEGEAHD